MAQFATVVVMTNTSPMVLPSGVEVDGNAIRELRKQLGFTITGLAPRVPMSIGYLSQIERGTRKVVSPPKFRELVSALGIASTPEKITSQGRRAA